METTQSVIARLEGGRVMPTTRTLEKIAKAIGSRLKISFEPNTRAHPVLYAGVEGNAKLQKQRGGRG
jgi:predicted transcriptional regulator